MIADEAFKKWMAQPGVIKKLQGFLCLSVIINLFLAIQIVQPINQKSKEVKNQIPQSIKVNAEDEPRQSKISETDLKDFIRKYITNFFDISSDAINFIKSFSSKNLFENSLKKELEARSTAKIISEFKLDDLILESISSNQAKALILGREIFPNGDYESRHFTIELIIDTEKIEVESIPVFKLS